MPFLTSAMLMWVVLYFIYPHYQYYIDPDGTAYLTISKRYANGDYHTAINGYWSPWACWLTAIGIKMGLATIPASVVVNSIGATGFLFISQSFFLKFGIERKLQWVMNFTLALFLCYAVFWQSFDDRWECFFLLGTLRIILADGCKDRPWLWVACGVVGTLAYFAKAYSFPFFILNTVCCMYFIANYNKAKWLKICAVSIGVMILCSLPWIWLLHGKYGIWTTSTAGTLNMSWYLVGHPHWKPGIDLLIPPAYKDSPYYWEDPYLANGDTPHFWDSWHLLGLQVLRVGLNCWRFLKSILQLSVFFPVVIIATIFSFFSKKVSGIFTGNTKVLAVSFLLFPLGYLLINFESRYLWYMLPLGMMLGGLLFAKQLKNMAVAVLLSLTFLLMPVVSMVAMYDEGAEDHKWVEQMRQLNIKGGFTCISGRGRSEQSIERTAYFSGNSFYSVNRVYIKEKIFAPIADYKLILQEMRKYHVRYFFALVGQNELLDENGKPFPEVTKARMGEGIRIYQVEP